MTEQEVSEEGAEGGRGSADEWSNIGEEFKALGRRLASAISSELGDEENRRRLEKLRSDIDEMAEEVSRAVHRTAASREAQEVQSEVEKVAHSAREAGRCIVKEARPYLLSALRSINRELQKLAARLEEEGPEREE